MTSLVSLFRAEVALVIMAGIFPAVPASAQPSPVTLTYLANMGVAARLSSDPET